MELNLSSKFEKLYEKVKDHQRQNRIEMELIHAYAPRMFIAVDLETEEKSFFLDITDEEWSSEQIEAFPKWNGIQIFQKNISKMGIIVNRVFLVIAKTKESSDEVFKFFLESLIKHILAKKENTLYLTTYKVLENWHEFFKVKRRKRLTLEEEMGLFGELFYIKNWLLKNDNQPPAIIKHWKGPLRYRVDFEMSKKAIEIKTFDNSKKRKEITIASEKQLELSKGQNEIQLYVLKISRCEASNLNIENLIREIETILSERDPVVALEFKNLLAEVEISLLEINYQAQDFEVEQEYAYQVTESFPKITPEMLATGITNVSYKIDLSHCEEFKIETSELYK